MYYSLSKNDPYMVDLDPPVHVREVVQEVVMDIQRKYQTHGVTLAKLREQIRRRGIRRSKRAGIYVG